MNAHSSPSLRRSSAASCFIAFWLSAAIFLSGCTSLNNVPLPSSGTATAQTSLRVGDAIEAHLKDGRFVAFKLTAIEPTTLVGGTQRVAFDEIAVLRVRRISPGKTAGLVGIVVVGTLVVLFIVAAASGDLAFMPSGPS